MFAWPGIGRLAFDALLARDYQVLLGVFLCTSILVVLFNLVTDLLYAGDRSARMESRVNGLRPRLRPQPRRGRRAGHPAAGVPDRRTGAGCCSRSRPGTCSGAPFQPPGETDFLLGSDSLGRDVAAGIAYGAHVSLLIGARLHRRRAADRRRAGRGRRLRRRRCSTT